MAEVYCTASRGNIKLAKFFYVKFSTARLAKLIVKYCKTMTVVSLYSSTVNTINILIGISIYLICQKTRKHQKVKPVQGCFPRHKTQKNTKISKYQQFLAIP